MKAALKLIMEFNLHKVDWGDEAGKTRPYRVCSVMFQNEGNLVGT